MSNRRITSATHDLAELGLTLEESASNIDPYKALYEADSVEDSESTFVSEDTDSLDEGVLGDLAARAKRHLLRQKSYQAVVDKGKAADKKYKETTHPKDITSGKKSTKEMVRGLKNPNQGALSPQAKSAQASSMLGHVQRQDHSSKVLDQAEKHMSDKALAQRNKKLQRIRDRWGNKHPKDQELPYIAGKTDTKVPRSSTKTPEPKLDLDGVAKKIKDSKAAQAASTAGRRFGNAEKLKAPLQDTHKAYTASALEKINKPGLVGKIKGFVGRLRGKPEVVHARPGVPAGAKKLKAK